MSFTITLGWWLLPLAITAIAFAWATAVCPKGGSLGDAIAAAFVFGPALIGSLVAWLIWAVLT